MQSPINFNPVSRYTASAHSKNFIHEFHSPLDSPFSLFLSVKRRVIDLAADFLDR